MLSQQASIVLVLGSQNSSNSQRLRELAHERGKQSHLIDGADDLRREWFSQADTVLITAGASAPESVVQSTIRWLENEFQASVREVSVRSEEVYFPLPKPLRGFAKPTGTSQG